MFSSGIRCKTDSSFLGSYEYRDILNGSYVDQAEKHVSKVSRSLLKLLSSVDVRRNTENILVWMKPQNKSVSQLFTQM